MFVIDADRKVRSSLPQEISIVLTKFIVKATGSKIAPRIMTANLIIAHESSERREFLEACLKLLITQMLVENLAKESW
jgi:hypothetical protein